MEMAAGEEGAEEFAKLLACIKQMQAGTTALVRSSRDGAELAISNVRLVEDLDAVVCTPLDEAQAGEKLTFTVGTDLESVFEPPEDSEQASVSIVLKLKSEALEMVFATDDDCLCWRAGLCFLKGALPAPDAVPEKAKVEKPRAKAAAAKPKVAAVAKPARSEEGDMQVLLQKNRELEEIVRRKEATIQQLLKEAREEDGTALASSAESDAHQKDRVIARLRTDNAGLKKKLEKKERAVQSLVEALNAMQMLREDDSEEEAEEEPALGPGTPGQFRPASRIVAPTPQVPRAPAPSPASVRPAARNGSGLVPPPRASAREPDEAEQLNGFIGELTTRFDGLESELKEKTALLAELQKEEMDAKEEHANLLQQLHEHEATANQVRSQMQQPGTIQRQAPPQRASPSRQAQPPQMAGPGSMNEDEAALVAMQDKVAQLSAMLSMLGGDVDDLDDDDVEEVPRSAPSGQRTTMVQPERISPRGPRPSTIAPAAEPLPGLPEGLEGLLGALGGLNGLSGLGGLESPRDPSGMGAAPGDLGGLGDALSGLEEKKRKIEQLAAMLNINLDQ